MSGFAHDGNGNELVYSSNVDFSGGATPTGQILQNGQLLIGSAIQPNIQVGRVTSPAGTMTIGYANPNITNDWAPLTNHAIVVGSGISAPNLIGPTATAGQVLQSAGASANPSFSTATYPSTTTINQILYSSSANIVGGISTANNGTLITSAAGIPSFLANGTTGQVLTATTGSPPSWAPAAGGSITLTGDSGGALSSSSFTITGGTTGHTFAGSGTTLTLGGVLILANGGTNANLTANNGGIFYSTSTAGAILAGTATAGQILLSGATAAPTWSTATYPATAGTSGNVLTSDGTNWSSSAAPGSGITTITGSLTNSQIKNLHGTPVQAIAAPGAGKTIVVLSAVGKMVYGGTNIFTAGVGQTISLYYATSVSACVLLTNALIVQSTTEQSIVQGATAGTDATLFDNKALNLYNPISTEISGNASNNNTAKYSITYYIATI